jgi:hypothetical protein
MKKSNETRFFMTKVILNKLCLFEQQSLWIGLLAGILFLIPGGALGIMIGVQIGAPLGAQIAAGPGYYLFPIVILLSFAIVFFIVGMNAGNFLLWFIQRVRSRHGNK